MATQPHPTPPKPTPPPPPPAKVEGAKHEAPTPPPVRTIADEQRERSDEIARMGVEKYKQSIDMRSPEDRPKVVEGVAATRVEESELRKGR
jgi:hypothetical protein